MGSIPCPLRLSMMKGFENRINDIVYCFPLCTASINSALVYFGGDVQDYPEVMESHRDNKHYIKWNLENTALSLRSSFPDSHIIIIKPSRMELKTFACYDSFVPSNDVGAPDHIPNHNSVLHLEKLLQNVTRHIKNTSKTNVTENSPESAIPDLTEMDLKLVGFSKGCVSLNQFLYEFHYWKTHTPKDDSSFRLVPHITDMYWLDGGHAGGKNTWITSRTILETFSKLGIRVHVHVTPYQINDKKRPWIRREEKLFRDLLKKFGATVERKLHFEDHLPTLETHFEVISKLRTK